MDVRQRGGGSWGRGALAVLLLAVLLPGRHPARGDPPDGTTEADVVREAVRTGDRAPLGPLAAELGWRTWELAEWLRSQGELECALALARAWEDPDAPALLGGLAVPDPANDPPEAWEAIEDALDHLQQGRAAVALDLLEVAEAPPGSAVAVRLAAVRGSVLQDQGRSREAAVAYRAGAEAAFDLGWRSRAADLHVRAGTQSWEAGDLRSCRECWERALEAYEARGEEEEAADVLADLGSLAARQGDLGGARRVLEQAATVYRRLGREAVVGLVLTNLCSVHQMRGDLAASLRAGEEALDLMERAGTPADKADACMKLGNVHVEVGDREGATALLDRAGSICDALVAAEPCRENYELLAATVGNRALADYAAGHTGSALAGLHRALDLFLAQAPEPEWIAACEQNLAEGYATLGDHVKAKRYYSAALRRLEETEDVLGAVGARIGLGRTHLALGNPEAARAAYETSRGRAHALGARTLEAQALEGIARVHLAGERPADAVAAAREAMVLGPESFRGLSAWEGTLARSRSTGPADAGAAAALVLRDAEAALFFLEGGRAGALLEALGGREAVRDVVLPPALVAADVAARSREEAAAVRWREAHAGGVREEIRAAEAEFSAARAAVLGARSRIEREAKAAAAVVAPTVQDRAGISSALLPGEAYVAYALLESSSLAVVVVREGARLVALPPRGEIEECARAAFPGEPLHVVEDRVPAVRDALVEPLALGADVRRVLVSPDGIVGFLPPSLLFGGREVAFVPSGTTLVLLRGQAAPPGDGVLALGDPVYDWSSRPPGRIGASLSRLAASGDEARALGDVVLVQEGASEESLRRALAAHPGRWRAVHFGCHGLVEDERPFLSSLALTRAGADDGFLTAIEVLGLEVDADMVVLSACDTARGRAVRGEGLMGLARAFMHAGAPRVVASLWKVGDGPARAFMERFHATWKGGRHGAAEALRMTQEAARAEGGAAAADAPAWVLWGLPE